MRLRYRYAVYSSGPHAIDQMHQIMHQMMMRSAPASAGAWQPATDVYETAEALVIQSELAGVREDDIDITLLADRITITGTRRPQSPASDGAYHLAGILYGEFRLDIPIPTAIQRDAVEASFENGLLTVALPKAIQRVVPTSVPIQTSAGMVRPDGRAIIEESQE